MSSFGGGFGGFGQNSSATSNSGFGGFGNNSNSSGAFGTGTTGAFGSGGNPNPTSGSGLFGNNGVTFNNSAGGFGSNPNSNLGFGTAKPAFGAPSNTGNSGLFSSATPTTSTSGFGAFGTSGANNNTFGGGSSLFSTNNKPATGFAAVGSSGAGSSSGLFGAGNVTTASNSNAFSTNPGNTFGGALNNPGIGSTVGDPPGTSVVPFQAYTEKEANGTTNVFQNLAFQDAYKKWSQDELRLADYAQGRRHGNASGAGAFGINSGFGSGGFGVANNNQTSSFVANSSTPGNPLFGTATTTSGGFGQSNTSGFGATTGSNLFGNKSSTPGFGGLGTTTTQSNAAGGLFSNNSSSGFSAGIGNNSAPTGFGSGGGLFGNSSNQNKTSTAPFGSGFGGSNSGVAVSFGNSNPGTSNAFGATGMPQNPSASANGLFNSGQAGNSNQAGGNGGIFGNVPQNQTPAFGSNAGFNSQAQPNAGGSLFGNNAPKATGGMFGGATAGGLFGSNAPNTSGFGNNNTNQNSGSGLFSGQKSTTTGAGLFGNSVTTQIASNGVGGFFGNVPSTNTQSQPQAASTSNMFGPSLTHPQPNKSGLFGPSTQSTGTGLFGNSTQQSTNSLFGNTNNQPQLTTIGPSVVGTSPSQAISHPGSQGLTTSLTDLSAYSSSLFANMGTAMSTSPGPVATPLSKPSVRRSSVLPMYKLNPASASRMATPLKRGFGISSYGTPSSGSSNTNTISSGLSRSLLGSGVGRGLSKSTSSNAIRRTLHADDGILAPGAFSSPTSGRIFTGANGASKKLIINRAMRSDLFSSPNKDCFGDGGPATKLAKRVSFETGEEPSSPIALIENGVSLPESTPPHHNPNEPDAPLAEEYAINSGHNPVAINEVDSDVDAPIKISAVNPTLEIGPWELSPSWDEIAKMAPAQRASVPNFRISRHNAATITFKYPVDLSGLTREELCGKIVKLKPREASVYPAGTKKPPRGQGLNVPAQLIIYQAWPRHPDNRGLDDISVKDHIRKLSRVTNTKFENYDKDLGVWTFSVPHFTTYGVDSGSDATDDEDEDDDASIEGKYTNPILSIASHSNKNYIPNTSETCPRLGSRQYATIDSPLSSEGFSDYQCYQSAPDQNNMLGRQYQKSIIHLIPSDDITLDTSPIGEQNQGQVAMYTSGGILRARMRAIKEAATHTDLLVVDGDDWTEMLRKTISPIKANRQVLRTRQESHYDAYRPLTPLVLDQTQITPNRFIDNHKMACSVRAAGKKNETSTLDRVNHVLHPYDGINGFCSSIDLMRSLFNEDGTTDMTMGTDRFLSSNSAPGFVKWPYIREKISGRKDDDCYEISFRGTCRPNWGPGDILIYSSFFNSDIGVAATSKPSSQQAASVNSKTLIRTSQQNIHIEQLSSDSTASSHAMLRHQMRISNINVPDQIQFANAKHHVKLVPKVCLEQSIFEEMSLLADANDQSGIQQKAAWDLAGILFTADDKIEVRSTRKEKLSRFWKSAVQESIAASIGLASSNEERALVCLSGCMIPEACKYLLDSGNFHLATLVSLINSSEQYRSDMQSQMLAWRQSSIISNFSFPIRSIYEILAANVCRCQGLLDVLMEDKVESFIISQYFGFDWKRAFGLRLWYATNKHDDVSTAVRMFKADISAGLERHPAPLCYKQKTQSPLDDSANVSQPDLIWGLLQLYADPRIGIESILPPNSQPPLDSLLAWQLAIALNLTGNIEFGSRGVRRLDMFTVELSSQLVREGDWISAIFVVLHLSEPEMRTRFVNDLLLRHAGFIGLETSSNFRILTADLKISSEWILEAQALYFRSVQRNYITEAQCFLRAGAFIEAHRVLIDRVAPYAIIGLDYTTLGLLLAQFHNHETAIGDWAYGGGVYQKFLQFTEIKHGGGPVPESMITQLLASLPTMETRLGQDNNNHDHVKYVAIACMADIIANAAFRYKPLYNNISANRISSPGVQALPLTLDRHLSHLMDYSWEYFTSVSHS